MGPKKKTNCKKQAFQTQMSEPKNLLKLRNYDYQKKKSLFCEKSNLPILGYLQNSPPRSGNLQLSSKIPSDAEHPQMLLPKTSAGSSCRWYWWEKLQDFTNQKRNITQRREKKKKKLNWRLRRRNLHRIDEEKEMMLLEQYPEKDWVFRGGIDGDEDDWCWKTMEEADAILSHRGRNEKIGFGNERELMEINNVLSGTLREKEKTAEEVGLWCVWTTLVWI